MVNTSSTNRIDILGAHRGGTTATLALLDGGSLPPIEVRLVDPTVGRAAALARQWTSAGYRAVPIAASAGSLKPGSPARVTIAATDDPAFQVEQLKSPTSDLTVAGLVIATRDAQELGGLVLGIGAVVPQRANQLRRDAVAVFECIRQLTDGVRVSSTAVNSPIFNMAQVDRVRSALYDELATDARRFLVTGRTEGRVVLSCAYPETASYSVSVRQRAGRSALAMRACHTSLLPGQAVIYLNEDQPKWMFAVIPTRIGLVYTPELPDSAGLERAIDEAARQRSASLYVTD